MEQEYEKRKCNRVHHRGTEGTEEGIGISRRPVFARGFDPASWTQTSADNLK
jgi:hypothetical protein